jgi:hypothetical protein
MRGPHVRFCEKRGGVIPALTRRKRAEPLDHSPTGTARVDRLGLAQRGRSSMPL